MNHPSSRPRRNRNSPISRAFARESWLGPQHFIYPLFFHGGTANSPILSMPGCERHTFDSLYAETEAALEDGIGCVVIFPKVSADEKTETAEQSHNPQGLVPRAVSGLKARFGHDLLVCTDVALDPYNSDGHDGIVSMDGVVLNDETVQVLVKQALCHADAGADIISPSDMMDGRVAAIRSGLDGAGHLDTSILSYTAKYASAFYGPFRDALDSAPRAAGGKPIPKDKATYQMDPANVREALPEGADMVMVKPAGPYLDVIRAVREATTLPVAAYQVSGEYAMLKAASQNGWLDEKKVVLESLLSIRRAGADVILTYYARQAAAWMRSTS